MEYARAVGTAPPGWRHFTLADVDRLPPSVRSHEMARVPEAERLLLARHDPNAVDRLRRALFWTFVYHLEPRRWHALAEAEPIHPRLLDALPERVGSSVDVGAGSGRLTRHLARRSGLVIAIEPASSLLRILVEQVPAASPVAGWAEAMPLPDASIELTAACGAFGPESRILDELWRVTATGGTVALISPDRPEWFQAEGWTRISVAPSTPPPHDAWIDEFFGTPEPPHELVMRTKIA